MSEKQFKLSSETVLQYQIMDNDTDLNESEVVDLLNVKEDTIQRLEKENQRVYGIIEDGGVLLTRKQLLDVIGEDKCDMFFQDQAIISALKEENEQLREEYAESLADEVKKNGLLNEEINQLRIENMRLKKLVNDV